MALQLGDRRGRDHFREGFAVLAHPQPEVGAAGVQQGVGMLRRRAMQFIERARDEIHLRAVPIILALGQGAQRLDGLARGAGEAVARPGGDAAAGIDDRAIAGAAAEIAGKRLVNERVLGAFAAVVEGEHRHHEARRAEPALGAIRVDERLLHRVERAVRGREPIDGEHLGAVELRHQHEAGVDRLVSQLAAVFPPDHDGAGAAIAFRAALFRAGQPRIEPQPVEHGRGRRHAALGARLAVQKEANFGHRMLIPLTESLAWSVPRPSCRGQEEARPRTRWRWPACSCRRRLRRR